MTLAKLKNDKLVSAEGLRIYEPYLSLHDTEGGSTYETGSLRMRDLLDPNKSKAYEAHSGTACKQTRLLKCHSLTPSTLIDNLTDLYYFMVLSALSTDTSCMKNQKLEDQD